MTSVLCSVCSLRIASENDRVYCYGGCENIYHAKCSDLNAPGITALKENAMLKYMCFGCRKNQLSLNDIQKNYSEMLTKVNQLFELMSTIEERTKQAVAEQLDNFRKSILPQCLPNTSGMAQDASIQDFTSSGWIPAPRDIVPASEHSSSYAAITRSGLNKTRNLKAAKQATPVVERPNRLLVERSESPSEGGLLRSGRRRIVQNPIAFLPSERSIDLTADHPADPPPSTPKSSAVRRLEETVLFKPKSDQTAETTKKDIRDRKSVV